MERFLYHSVLTKSLLAIVVILILVISQVTGISIDATGSIPDWEFSIGPNQNPSNLDLTVTTDTASWSVTVMDNSNEGKSRSHAGKLVEYNTTIPAYINDGQVISTNMTVTGDSKTNIIGSAITLGPDEQTIETGSVQVSGQQLSITLNQPITYADAHLSNGNIYRTVLTFTVGAL